MASITRRPTSKYWVACFTTLDGRQLKRSTKVTDRKQALQIANEFELAYRKRRTEDQVRKVLFDIHEEITGQKLETASVETFITRWLERGKATLSPRTYAKYAGVVRQFIESLKEKAKADISIITVADISAFRDELASRLSVGSANVALKIVRSVFGEALRQSLISSNPAAQVKILTKRVADQEQRRPFTLPELIKILAVADDEWQGIILTGLYTGQRLGDIARLTWQNIDLIKAELSFVARKTGRRQNIPIAKPLMSHLEKMTVSDNPRQPLFPNAIAKLTNSKNEETGALSNAFRAILESVGLAEARVHDHSKKGTGRSARRNVSELSFHCLRHTATSLLKNAGVSDVVAREIIGHDSEVVSRNYTHIETSTLRNAVDLLPDILAQGTKVRKKSRKKK